MNTNDLATALAARNAATRAWVAEAPDTRWATTLVEDLAHWASVGVTTASELEHYLLVCEAFEATRSAWGYKPSWSGLMGQTDEALRASIASDLAHIRAEREQVAREEQANAEAFARALEHKSGWTIGEIVA